MSSTKAEQTQYGLSTAVPEEVGMSTERLVRIVPAMKPFVEQGQVPGLLTAVARKGHIVHFETQGYSDVDNGLPLGADTIFRIYSMTKPITGVAVMMLYEEGHFSLDDPIAAYLPEFANMKVYRESAPPEPANPITIWHLLTYTAGLVFGAEPKHPVEQTLHQLGLTDVVARLDGLTLQQYIEKLSDTMLFAQPGTEWRYGEETNVLARLVEVISQQTYGDFLQQRLFGPLGMVDTAFYVPAEKLHRFGPLYIPTAEGCMTTTNGYGGDFSKQPPLESGSAGLVSTAADYLRFAQMLLNGGELDGTRILSPTTVRLMTSNHLGPEFGEAPLASLALPAFTRPGIRFGFTGLVVTDAIATGTAGSNGQYSWGGWASTDFWIDFEQQLIGMVLTQLLPTGTYPTRNRMHQMSYQAIID